MMLLSILQQGQRTTEGEKNTNNIPHTKNQKHGRHRRLTSDISRKEVETRHKRSSIALREIIITYLAADRLRVTRLGTQFSTLR